jgi:hypothetical protein
MEYKDKYLKYKAKYLHLKSLIGSGSKKGDGPLEGPPYENDTKMYFYVLLGDGSGDKSKTSDVIMAHDGRFVNGHVAIGMELSKEEMETINSEFPDKLIMDKIPIIGLGPLLPSEIYEVKEEDGRNKIYLKEKGLDPVFWKDFKQRSYESQEIENKYDLRVYYDTKLFHIEEEDLAPQNKDKQKNRKLYRFEIYPNFTNEKTKLIFIDLLKKSLNSDPSKTVVGENYHGKPVKYGILKNQEKCYSYPEFGAGQSIPRDTETKKYEVFNCITSIINIFKPYMYRKDTLADGKILYAKVFLETLGVFRCARIRYLTLHLMNNIGKYAVYTMDTKKYIEQEVQNITNPNLNMGYI